MSYIVVGVNLEQTMYNGILQCSKDYQVKKLTVQYWIQDQRQDKGGKYKNYKCN